jgi:hypothetical protein
MCDSIIYPTTRYCWIYDATSAAVKIASDYFCIRKGGADDFRS